MASSIKMTMDMYGHLLPGDRETTVAALDRAFARKDVTKDRHFFGSCDQEPRKLAPLLTSLDNNSLHRVCPTGRIVACAGETTARPGYSAG